MIIIGQWEEAYLRPLGRGLRLGPLQRGVYFDDWLGSQLVSYSLSSGAALKRLRITIQVEENEAKPI